MTSHRRGHEGRLRVMGGKPRTEHILSGWPPIPDLERASPSIKKRCDPVCGTQGNRIRHVHCENVRRKVLTRLRADDTSFLDAVLDGVLTAPGEACIDFSGVLAELAAVDTKAGWLSRLNRIPKRRRRRFMSSLVLSS